jgi:hypothetical protein
MEQPVENKKENNNPDALTSIHETYTLSTTQDANEIMKNHFLETLAEVSLSIASRKVQHKEKGIEQCEP